MDLRLRELRERFENPPGMDPSTAAGAKNIFRRFIAVAVSLNVLVVIGVMIFDVADSLLASRQALQQTGELIARIAFHMRASSGETDEVVLKRADELTRVPMALIDPRGAIHYSSNPGVPLVFPQVYPRGPIPGTRFIVRRDLGDLSGAWVLTPFSARHHLLVVIRHRPEDEGVIEYMTFAAGVTGLGMALSVVIMFIAANWMLRRPLSRLVSQLTGALEQDVQRRKLAEEQAVRARLDAEEHLAFRENLIEASTAVGIVATDSDGLIQVFNRAAEQILGRAASEVVGCSTLDQLERSWARPPEAGRDPAIHPQPGEELIRDQQGNPHLLDIKRNAIRDVDGRVRGQLLTFIDLTDRRRLEAELQLKELKLIQSAKLATLGEMATGVAHELNQPLNNIQLLSSRMTRKLRQAPLGEEDISFLLERIGKVQTQVDRASRIIEQLRTFGRVRPQTMSRIAPRAAVDSVLLFVGEQLREHGIRLDLELPEDLPQVIADEAQLEQVLMNLLVNARDALDECPAGSGAKRILIAGARCALEQGGPGVCLQVRDNGPGMSREVQDRIFDPFFTTKDVGKGTGLGLSISYGLVRDFGGTLEVQSEPGQGSVFFIKLREAPSEPE